MDDLVDKTANKSLLNETALNKPSFAQKLEKLWYEDHPCLRLLRPLSWIFSKTSAKRRIRLQKASTSVFTARPPIVVVGNITLGGTGKTPMIIALLRLCEAAGLKPAVVSRGYGGNFHKEKSVQSILLDSTSKATYVGDEPLEIFRATGVPVAVAGNRNKAIETLMAAIPDNGLDIIFSDDGLQHYAMPRDYEIALVDAMRLFGNGRLMPEGPLREPISRLKEVNCVLLNGEPDSTAVAKDSIVADALQGSESFRLVAKCLRCPATGEEIMLGLPETDAILQRWNTKYASSDGVLAVAAIGNPQRFFDSLLDLGLTFMSQAYDDHQQLPIDVLNKHRGAIVITQKDAVKLSTLDARYWVLDVVAQLPIAWSVSFMQNVEKMITQTFETPSEESK